MSEPVRAGAYTSSGPLHIVLFGRSGAGKTSLLGALAKHISSSVAGLHDPAQCLATLRQQFDDGRVTPTHEETVFYAVPYDAVPKSHRSIEHHDVVFVDCDGRVAGEFIEGKRSLNASHRPDSLAPALHGADALFVLIDATTAPEEFEGDFAALKNFLERLEEYRGQERAVGGLPIFLVLTKCDLLAGISDSTAMWIERIEGHKARLASGFQDFLDKQKHCRLLPFGSLDVHIGATAVKDPPLTDQPAQTREPFGMAELFDFGLDRAAHFRERSRRASRRTAWTVASSGAILSVLLALIVGLSFFRPREISPSLAAAVDAFRATLGPEHAVTRLGDPLETRTANLRAILDDPEFSRLSRNDQRLVRTGLRELEDYAAYRDKLGEDRLGAVQSEADARTLEDMLNHELALPDPYRDDWRLTRAAQHRGEWLAALQTLHATARETAAWFEDQARAARDLRAFRAGKPADAPSWEDWLNRASAVLDRAPPHNPVDEIANAKPLTYGSLWKWASVQQARRDWEEARPSFQRLRDVVALLGLAGRAPDGSRQPLDIPRSFSLEQVHNHANRLRARFGFDGADLSALALSESVDAVIRQAARKSYEHLLEPGRSVVLDHLRRTAGGKDSWEAWSALRPWLEKPEDLRDWRLLAMPLLQIQGGTIRDPIDALAAFVARERFDLKLESITLTIPWDDRIRPTGPLTVYHGSGSEPPHPALTFKASDEDGKRMPQGRVTQYEMKCESNASIQFRPGDSFYATMPVRKLGATGNWMLTWARGRSTVYQFERLHQPPRLHERAQENTRGQLLDGIVLKFFPELGVPPVPDLMPVVLLATP